MRLLSVLFLLTFAYLAQAQNPKPVSSADILHRIKKLEVFGSVLYIAAHPDDENTRLLSYLANERLYRTGYLSLTRGDGGQNLIGDEQGIDLGLIRTEELLAARRVDGAEQFFTRAYDFGYSKNPEEALRIWDHDKILSDVVWVIRKFRPDVIITRFPTTGEGGHGHHTASAILASEAFDAAADPNKFPQQLENGVTTWTPKRLLWNTFNFGSPTTNRDDQLKIDVGGYNAMTGLSYGEMAAESRSNHRSQGFGVPAQRGSSIEYFLLIKGSKATSDIMDDVDVTIHRIMGAGSIIKNAYSNQLKNILRDYNAAHPSASLPGLTKLYKSVSQINDPAHDKRTGIAKLIADASGIFIEAIAHKQLNTIGDSIKVNLVLNNRTGVPVERAQASLFGNLYEFGNIKKNENAVREARYLIPAVASAAQPYWLEKSMSNGSFIVDDLSLIGKPVVNPYNALFQITINGTTYDYKVPVQYKYTDPVKGEIYQPIQFIRPVFINSSPSLIIFSNEKKEKRTLHYTLQSNLDLKEKISFKSITDKGNKTVFDSLITWSKGERITSDVVLSSDDFANNTSTTVFGEIEAPSIAERQGHALNKISYDHIPDIYYNYVDATRVLKMDLKTEGKQAGYIAGAGDKISEALQQMGYHVTLLQEEDITNDNIRQFDVIITGVRAYNVHAWLSNVYPQLMQYVKEGGVLVSQYNTNNSIGPVRARIAPYPFTISRNRVTDEKATVTFLLPDHPALNYPNKITDKDFEGWVQERSIYHAENVDPNYQKVLSIKDPGEKEQDGSLIIANYGNGRFVYTGIVFFRELPAGVPGAYRLFANLIANRRK